MKRLLAVAVLMATPVFAQAPAAPQSALGTTMGVWQGISAYIVQSAEQMPEADYAYKPVATVRSFGQLIGHVAGSQNMFCAAALGEKQPAENDIEKNVTTKAGLVAALKASNDYCRRAYMQTDAQAMGTTRIFDADATRMAVLTQNATHIAEHYGNMVTYFRMKGMIPPSSAPRPGQ